MVSHWALLADQMKNGFRTFLKTAVIIAIDLVQSGAYYKGYGEAQGQLRTNTVKIHFGPGNLKPSSIASLSVVVHQCCHTISVRTCIPIIIQPEMGIVNRGEVTCTRHRHVQVVALDFR